MTGLTAGLSYVGADEEIHKQDEERAEINDTRPLYPLVVVTVNVNGIHVLSNHNKELHLQKSVSCSSCHPQILLCRVV